MTEDLFRTSIAFLQSLFGHTLSDENYRMYWSIIRLMSDDDFKAASRNIVATFIPTRQVPFPVPAQFTKPKDELKEIPFAEMYEHKPLMIVDKKELPENGYPIEALELLPEGIRKYLDGKSRDNKGMQPIGEILK